MDRNRLTTTAIVFGVLAVVGLAGALRAQPMVDLCGMQEAVVCGNSGSMRTCMATRTGLTGSATNVVVNMMNVTACPYNVGPTTAMYTARAMTTSPASRSCSFRVYFGAGSALCLIDTTEDSLPVELMEFSVAPESEDRDKKQG